MKEIRITMFTGGALTALALVAAPTMAQVADPAIVPAPAPAAPALDPVTPPAATVGTPAVTPTISAPVIQPAPAPTSVPKAAAPAPAPAAPKAGVKTSGTPMASNPPRAVAPATGEVAIPTEAPKIAAPPQPAQQTLSQPQPQMGTTTAPRNDANTGLEIGALAALLAALGLGGAAVLARRRRRAEGTDTNTRHATTLQPQPASIAPPTDRSGATFGNTAPAAAVGMASAQPPTSSPERFSMPSGPVPTGADRQALLDRMVDAPADAANPFTSRAGRRKRARIILQHREYQLRQQAAAPFDWRSYQPSGAYAATAAKPAFVT